MHRYRAGRNDKVHHARPGGSATISLKIQHPTFPQTNFTRIMATDIPALTYGRLNDDEVRLITFVDGQDQAEGGISCQLEHVRLSQNPVFFALSYVWGDGDARKPLFVDGHWFLTTQNLHDAFSQIRQHAPAFQEIVRRESGNETQAFRLWADALCINQEDADERSSQVPRMKDIYARAYNVLAWMGTLEQTGLNAHGYSFSFTKHSRLRAWLPSLSPLSNGSKR